MLRRSTDELPELPVSHNERIHKRQLFRNGEVPHLTQIAQAAFPPGELAPSHAHADMAEIFIVKKGNGLMEIDGIKHRLAEGDCILVSPGERHELSNCGPKSLVVLVIGIQV